MDSHQQLGYGLLRFRSASSFLLGSFAETGPGKLTTAPEGFEARKLGSRFMGVSASNMFDERLKESPAASPHEYTGLPPQYPWPSSVSSSSAMEGSYGTVGSMGMEPQSQLKLNSSDLARQSSSPPCLFTQPSTQNGYAAIKGQGIHRAGSGFNGEVSPTNKWRNQFSFPSSIGMLSQISETGSESLREGGPDDSSRLGIGIGESQISGPGFYFNPRSDSFTSLERDREDDVKLFPGSQNGELGNLGPLLSHHMSLPRTSSGMPTMEKFLQFQDSGPFKIRAKRGCATHPRSIAERVRRTRISERMRKLQELVPNMDKQTNTADMLDLAVDYIKDLQKQFEILRDSHANCKCSNL